MSAPIYLPAIKFTIVDINPVIVAAFKSVFKSSEANFGVLQQSIAATPADCIVCPGNSFGLMDGGADGVINTAMDDISTRLIRPTVFNRYFGEAPVGSCFVLQSGHATWPWVAYAPTMQVPTDVSDTYNAYIAMRGVLCAIEHASAGGAPIKTVVLTPLCTGAGKMDPVVAAKQMLLAWKKVTSPLAPSWKEAASISGKLWRVQARAGVDAS